MLARVTTFAIDGVHPRQVWVEVDIRSGLPAFTIVGLGDTAVRESRTGSGRRSSTPASSSPATESPPTWRRRSCARPARASTPRSRSPYSRPAGRSRDALGAYAVFGELSLGGELRDSPGALAVAEGARRAGCQRLIVPRQRAREAAIVQGLEIVAVTCLRAAAEVVMGADPPPLPEPPPANGRRPDGPDLSDVRGHGAPFWPSRSPRREPTISCSRAPRGPVRRCSHGGCRRSCRG